MKCFLSLIFCIYFHSLYSQDTVKNMVIDTFKNKKQNNPKTIKQVVISNPKNWTKYTKKGIEYNVEKSELASLSSLNDVLNQLPNMSVENESQIKIRGNEDVLVLVNGKKNILAQQNLQTFLQSISPQSIKSIEVILNPDVQYEANGISSIIDIKLKKNIEGWNGNISSNIGTASEMPLLGVRKIGANLFYGKNKTSFSFSYLFNNVRNNTYNLAQRNLFADNHALNYHNFIKSENLQINNPLYFGFDYSDFKNLQISVSSSINFNNRNLSILNNTDKFYTDTFHNKIETTDNEYKFNVSNYFQLKYDLDTFGRILKLDCSHSIFDLNDRVQFANNAYNSSLKYLPISSYTENRLWDRHFYNYLLKLDLIYPIKKNYTVSFGLKNELNIINEKYKIEQHNFFQDTNTIFNNHYQDNVFGLYFNNNINTQKLNVNIGLRYEFTNIYSRELGIRYQLNDLFPNISFSFKRNNSNVSFGFKRSIYRPKFEEIRIFSIRNELANSSDGNPKLLPSYDNQIFIDFYGMLFNSNISTGFYIQYKTNYIENITTNNLNYLNSSTKNVGNMKGVGFYSHFDRYLVPKKIKIGFDYGIKVFNIEPNLLLNLNSKTVVVNWAKLNISYFFTNNFFTNVLISANTGWDGLQRYQKANILSSFNLNYKIPKARLNFNISFTDPFNLNKTRTYFDEVNYSIYSNNYWQSRILTFGCNYQFGSKPKQINKKEENERYNNNE